MICLNMNCKGTLKISSSFSDKACSASCTNRKKKKTLQNVPDFQVFYQAVTLIVILVLSIPITKTYSV